MNDHLEAMAAMLGPTGIAVEIGAALPEKLPPYYVIAPLAPTALPDGRLSADDPDLELDIRVTAVSGTAAGALDLLARARAIFAPDYGPSFPAVTGRKVQLDWLRFEVVDIDTSIKIPTTNRNPAYAVDSYSLSSQPTA